MQNSALPRSAETLAVLREIQALVPAGRYRHFKGGEYTIVRVLERVNSGMCDVEYFAHYGAYENQPATRELVGPDSFLRPVDRSEYKGVRFDRLDHVTVDETVLLDVYYTRPRLRGRFYNAE